MKEQKIQGPSLVTTLFLSWFYTGKFPKAPGTIGSLATVPLIYLLHYLQINIYSLLALILVLSVTATAVAKGPVASLRVVGKGGKVLAEDSFGAATVSVKSSPKADCFGAGTGGSGKSLTIKGPTALGMLVQAAKFTAALKPVLISDSFDFGLAL